MVSMSLVPDNQSLILQSSRVKHKSIDENPCGIDLDFRMWSAIWTNATLSTEKNRPEEY